VKETFDSPEKKPKRHDGWSIQPFKKNQSQHDTSINAKHAAFNNMTSDIAGKHGNKKQ